MQRQLLNALLAALATTALIGALLPLAVLAAPSQNCPAGYDHKSDPPKNLTVEWGTATLVNGGSAVSFYVKGGYTVDVCVKGGNKGFDTEIIVGEKTVVVATPTNQAVSHYEWRSSTTPTSTTPTTEGSTTSTSQPTSTTTNDSTTTSTTAYSTTSTSDPATTTSTTGPSTTSTTQSSSSTTSSDEVLEGTLPFTGSPTDGMSTFALSLLAAGILILLATRRVEDA